MGVPVFEAFEGYQHDQQYAYKGQSTDRVAFKSGWVIFDRTPRYISGRHLNRMTDIPHLSKIQFGLLFK